MIRINKKYHTIAGMLMLLLFAFSCTDDLNRFPTNGTTNDIQYNTLDGYKQSLTTIYATLAYSDFLRNYWNMQELTTDEAVSTWDDNGILSYHIFNWTADNIALGNVYTTVLYNITLCNNFLIEASDDKLAKRGFSGQDVETIKQYAAESRFMRAYYFWMLLDLYGNPPFPTENSLLSGDAPKQIQKEDLYTFIESELKEIEPLLVAPKSNEYGRADQAACWSLLAHLYQNAPIYIGIDKSTDVITYCKKVIDGGYSLENHYSWLMLADNYLNSDEFIFTINFDNAKEITWGGTNYLALGAAGVTAEVNGMSASWNSLRMTQQIPALFPTTDTLVDKRAQFWTNGQILEVKDLGSSTDGYSNYKFRNLNRNGQAPAQNNTYNNICDIDYPIFRLAEIYLSYAEAVIRGGEGGDLNTALSYINKIRGRAYAGDPASTDGNITLPDLTLDFILDERGRELYWETYRRTDLIRFNKLTTNEYLWAWKGGVKQGIQVADKYKIFPIPTSDLLANPNLKQNKDY